METLDLNCQEAFFPFIPILLIAIGALFATWLVKLITAPKGYDIAILGNQGSGKSTLWNAITSNSSQAMQTIDREKIREVTVERGGVKRKIKQSYDISGGEDSIKRYYEELCTGNTFIIYIFDCSKFELDQEYKMEVFMRLRTVGHIIQKCNDEKYIHIIGSHLDKLTNDKQAQKITYAKQGNELLETVNAAFNKQLEKEKNFILLDLTDEKSQNKYINDKLFNN